MLRRQPSGWQPAHRLTPSISNARKNSPDNGNNGESIQSGPSNTNGLDGGTARLTTEMALENDNDVDGRKSPPMDIHERVPLNTSQSNPYFSRAMTYGSIIPSPPLHSPPSFPPELSLPDPAISPDDDRN